MNLRELRHLKEELSWVIDKRLQAIRNKILSCTTKKLKNKVVLNLNNIVCIAMRPLVTYSKYAYKDVKAVNLLAPYKHVFHCLCLTLYAMII